MADVESRRGHCSASTKALVVPHTTHPTTIVDRVFPVAAARVWNNLPSFVTSSPSWPHSGIGLRLSYVRGLSARKTPNISYLLTECGTVKPDPISFL